MTTLSTKHTPYREKETPALREVPIPHLVKKAVQEDQFAVVLGAREPDEGRYDTLSRKAYKGGTRKAAGEPSIAPKNHDEVYGDAKAQALDMRNRHFFLSDDPKLLTSEARGNHCKPPKGWVQSNYWNNWTNARLMNSHSTFVSAQDEARWRGETSESRAHYVQHGSEVLGNIADAAKASRKLQQKTNFALGLEPRQLQSESRAMYKGEQEETKTKVIKSNLLSTVNIGSSDTDVRDSLRSLKEVDYKHHPWQPVSKTVLRQQQETSMVLGYAPKQLQSLSRASYTPTVYTHQEVHAHLQGRSKTPGLPSVKQ